VVGLGPGDPLDRTPRAENAIRASEVVYGYTTYCEQIEDLTAGKEVVASGMRRERERCLQAVKRAGTGATVALVSSGDAGVYGMAGPALEAAAAHDFPVPVEIVPGVSAAAAAAAKLGAPLMLDYACISLSDLLVPWAAIEKRLAAVLAADMVVALYNPRSKTRVEPFDRAVELALHHRDGTTPVGVAREIGREGESIRVVRLDRLHEETVDMRTVVIIGNAETRRIGPWMVEPRGYGL